VGHGKAASSSRGLINPAALFNKIKMGVFQSSPPERGGTDGRTRFVVAKMPGLHADLSVFYCSWKVNR